MFYLWIGAMAGILLTYPAMRAAHHRPSAGSWHLWLAGAVALMLLTPVVLDYIKTEFIDGLGLIEAIKTVLIPWFAGVGLGLWIYLVTIPLRRLLRTYRRRMRGRMSRETDSAQNQFGQDAHNTSSWRRIRDAEDRLRHLNAADPNSKGLVKPCNTTAIGSTDAWLSSMAEPDFNYALPCGTQLAAMLCNAADKLDSAAREVELLRSTDDLKTSFKRAMLATLQASNAVACFLSQNIEFADKRDSIPKMEEREDYVAKMVNARRGTD
jgi:hypothetical protein